MLALSHYLGWEGVRLGAWLVLLFAIFVPLERLFALHRQRVFRAGFFADAGYYFLNNLLPKVLLLVGLSVMARVAHQGWPLPFYELAAGSPVWVRAVAALAVAEVGYYWAHRWSHEIAWLWRFHAVHHSAEEMDWLVNTRAHPIDLLFTRVCSYLPLYVLGLAQPSSATTDAVPALVMIGGSMWGFFVHANLKWRFGAVEWLVSTPAFHHWHHDRGPEFLNHNYSSMFPAVDWLFGTLHLPRGAWPAAYGAGDVVDPRTAWGGVVTDCVASGGAEPEAVVSQSA